MHCLPSGYHLRNDLVWEQLCKYQLNWALSVNKFILKHLMTKTINKLRYAGAQFGTIISMPLSGLLAEYSWPSIFYVFGAIGVVWSLLFLWTVYEDPQSTPSISDEEKNFINEALWGNNTSEKSPDIPWKSILTSMPFYAILFAHVSSLIDSRYVCLL